MLKIRGKKIEFTLKCQRKIDIIKKKVRDSERENKLKW